MLNSYSKFRLGTLKTRMSNPFGAISFQTGTARNATTFLPITEIMKNDDVDLIQFHDLHPGLYNQFLNQDQDFWKWLENWWCNCVLIHPELSDVEKWGWQITYVHNDKVFERYGQHEEYKSAINQMLDAVFKLIELDEIQEREKGSS